MTIGYQTHIGRRAEGQTLKGKYTVTSTKSLASGVGAVWALLVSSAGVALWLRPLYEVEIAPGAAFETEDGYYGEIRTLARERRIRLSWRDANRDDKGTTVQVTLVKRPGGRCILVIDHGGIPDQRLQAAFRVRWKAGLAAVQAALAQG